jgi:hypothetical protein
MFACEGTATKKHLEEFASIGVVFDDARARGGTRIRVLREGAKRGGDCHHKNHDRQDAGIAAATHRRFSRFMELAGCRRKVMPKSNSETAQPRAAQRCKSQS